MRSIYISPSNQYKNVHQHGNYPTLKSENEYCEEVAKALQEYLCANYIVTVYVATREADIATKGESKIENRVAEAEQLKVDLYLPLHTNGYNGSVKGVDVFYKDSKGSTLAKSLFDAVKSITGNGHSCRANTVYEVRTPSMPSEYIEIGYHDNADETAIMHDKVNEIAVAIGKAIADYFKLTQVKQVKHIYKVCVDFDDEEKAIRFAEALETLGTKNYITKEN